MNFPPNTHVDDVTFSPDDAVATSIAVKTAGGVKPIPVDSRDVVLMTLGSQVADMTIGSMKAPAQHLPPNPGECWALWQKIAKGRPQFGNPDKFFGPLAEGRAMWVTFTVTMNDPTFLNCLSVLTGTDPSRAGLITLTDSPWKITIAPLPKPHFSGQPDDTMVLWGYSITPEQPGTYVGGKPMDTCSGSEILTETIRHLGFDNYLVKILGTSVCIPCVLPRAGSVWLKRCQADRPKVFPDGAKNFAFIGQFCELPKDTMFTMEYSVRSAREAVSRLFHLPDRSPPVYQGWQDPQALFAAFKTLCL